MDRGENHGAHTVKWNHTTPGKYSQALSPQTALFTIFIVLAASKWSFPAEVLSDGQNPLPQRKEKKRA